MSTQKQPSEPAGNDGLRSTGLIVLGMHRSGTSALAGALGLCGAWLGERDELTEANVENPKGFWERRDVRAICDRLLHDAGADWWKVEAFGESAIPEATIAEQGRAFQQVLAKLETHGVWAVKEPRLCLLFRVLRPFFPAEPVCIHVYRNPLDVARSLRARNGFGIAEGLALWEAYNVSALKASAGLPRLRVSYESLVSRPKETLGVLLRDLTSIGIADLRMPSADQLEAFITPTLRHQASTAADTKDFLLPSQRALWSRLLSGEALFPEPPASPSVVAHQYLRDLELRKSSIDELRTRARKSASALRRQKGLAETLRAEVRQLTSEVEAQHSRASNLEALLKERTAAAETAESELRAEAEELRAELKASEASLRRIASTAAFRRDELDKLAARHKVSEQRIGELEAQLAAVYSSQSWRITMPLRTLSRAVRWVYRRLRNAVRLSSWLVTGQFGRVADVLLPRYRRYVPARVRSLVPRTVRQRLRSRLGRTSSTQSMQARSRGAATAAPQLDVDAFRVLVSKSRYAQELRRILEPEPKPGITDMLRKSEDQLARMAGQLNTLIDRPLVSVIMPTYNRASIIGGAIATVLEQAYPNWELLVCDDDSVDDTEAVVAGYFDSRIRYLRQPKQGAAAARNHGLKHARGQIIAYLDSNNFWHPAFLSAIVRALLEHPGHSAVYTDFIDFHIDKYGRRKRTAFKKPLFDHERLLRKPFIDLNSFAHRRELYDCFGGFDERLTRRQDYDLILKYTWLRDPLHVRCLTTLYQRNDSLSQITRVEREDRSCISIINRTLDDYFANGLPAVGRPAVERVTILSWDMCRNHFSKPFALAEALSPHYDVQLISFRFFDEEIFPPLKEVDPSFETLYLPGSTFPDFFESLRRALEAIRGDVIYVVKPRLPSLGLALLANYTRGIPLILEINDLETVVASPRQRLHHSEAKIETVDLEAEELLTPYDDLWSRLMHPIAKELPVLVTHNRGLDREFGHRCLYMRNIKDETVYDPAAYDRDLVRAELGFAPEDRVILFGGLIRKHKGIYELVELVERLDDPRYKLLFVGSRTTPDQRKLIERYGDRVSVLPPQDRTAMAGINYAADLVILWLDPETAASHYQMPYKATDAFAMGPSVIANDVSDFGTLARQGYLRIVPFGDWEAMSAAVRDTFERADETAAGREANRRLFLRQFSYAAARGNFQLAAARAVGGPPGTLPVAEKFALRFNEFYRRVTNADHDFVSTEREQSHFDFAVARNIDGYGESEADESIVLVSARNVGQLLHDDPAGVAVIMPSVDPRKGLDTARLLVKRSGMKLTVFVVEDMDRQGFTRTLNETAQRLTVAYVCYVAEDAFPGIDWLRIAYDTLERTGKGLLAFNDGKWDGRIAGFGMVRTGWARSLYGGPIFFPGYRAHKADNELTLVARIMNEFVYEPMATLVELDASKTLEGAEGTTGQNRDRSLFYERFHGAFDARFAWEQVAPYKDEYLNLRKLRAEQGERFQPADDAIELADAESLQSFSRQDPEGIAVIMPCIRREKGLAAARLLVGRAGIAVRVYVIEDVLRKGFIATLNAAAAQLEVKYIVYVAEDAFPGRDWLRKAHARLEETGKGLLAFNCGKWHGRIAAFGMVRKDWVRQVYGPGVILHPAYRAHKADNELTVIARVTDQFVYEPGSVLIENDAEKVFKESVPEDKATFHRRFRSGFDGITSAECLKPLAESYFVPMDPDSAAGIRVQEKAAVSGSGTMTSLRAEVMERERSRKDDPALSGVLDALRLAAEHALQRGPYSVTDKTTLPPSGSSRDYWHPAPYWWPDPTTADGLPYVRRDGERVPGTRLYEPGDEKYDRTRLQRVFDDSLIFGLAWYYFEERRYAEAGARILERFFTSPATGMTPHLQYAQVRLGHSGNMGSAAGLIESKDMYFYLDAVRLLQHAGVLSDTSRERFRGWLGTYLDWLLSSEQGKAECAALNNHGTCYDLQVAAIASFLGEVGTAHKTLERAQQRIPKQFATDGRQPEELKRRTTAHYCCFNLQTWINLAELASRWSVDLWKCETPDGAGLKQAAKWLLAYLDKPWPHEQAEKFDDDRFLPIWFAAAEQCVDLHRPERAPAQVHDVKPVFFPHDGIRPFWNLASYAAAPLPDEPQSRSRGRSLVNP